METAKNLIQPLLDRAEAYGKTSFELLKLKALNKTAEVSSTLVSSILLIITFLIFVFMLSIGIAFWIGDSLGKTYYGFLIVAGFYAIMFIIMLLINPTVKKRVTNAAIKQLFN